MSDRAVTGAYIYNTVKILKMKLDMLKLVDKVDVDWIIKEIRSSLDTISKVRNVDFLNDKLNNGSKIGFEDDYEPTEKIIEQDMLEYEEPDENSQRTRAGIIKELKRRGGLGGLMKDDED
jgi:hypothetical protein